VLILEPVHYYLSPSADISRIPGFVRATVFGC
jgi:hypothetical protein